MRIAIGTDELREPEEPHCASGSGKIIRPGSYGHVEVTACPRPETAEVSVDWQVRGKCIPEEQREPVLTASRRLLESMAAAGKLRCGVLLVIEYGSYHEASLSAHAEAAELAVTDALQRGLFTRDA
jgi:hypothetical protein